MASVGRRVGVRRYPRVHIALFRQRSDARQENLRRSYPRRHSLINTVKEIVRDTASSLDNDSGAALV